MFTMNGKPWTNEENEFVRSNWNKMTAREISAVLGRSRAVIANHRQKLGLNKKSTEYTPEEDEFIRAHWKTMSDSKMATVLHRSELSICRRRNLLGLKHRLTKQEADFIEENWDKKTIVQIARELGRSPESLDVRVAPKVGCLNRLEANRPWTPKEDDFLEEYWGDKTMVQIAKLLERSSEAVYIRARKLGLGNQLECSNMMNIRQVSQMLGVSQWIIRKTWIPKYNFPAKQRSLNDNKRKYLVVHFDKLLPWLKKHQDLWDSRCVEVYALGQEYDWLIKKRQLDKQNGFLSASTTCRKWTAEEDARLTDMYWQGNMTMAQMASELGRTTSAIANRLRRRGIHLRKKNINSQKCT